MKTFFDIESILFRLLNGNTDANGGVYPSDERPADSRAEDICINTITMENDALPLMATSNVNVYVADKNATINGRTMVMPDKPRLKELTAQVLTILRNAHIDGCLITPTNVTMLADATTAQHYANIRVNWNINN